MMDLTAKEIIEKVRWDHRDGLGVANPKGRCARCEVPWPCPAFQAADRIDALERALATARTALEATDDWRGIKVRQQALTEIAGALDA